MACLSERASALSQTATLLAEHDHSLAVRALDLVTNLPALAACSNVAALEAAVPLPSDPAAAATVAAVREDLARVGPLERAGRQGAAFELVDYVVIAAQSIEYPPVLAEALLQRGKVRIHTDRAKSIESLQRALTVAVSARADDVAAEAAVLLLYARATAGQSAAAVEDLPLAEALVARVPNSGRLRGLLLHNTAAVALAGGESERARELFGEALRVKQEVLDPDDLEIAYTLTSLALLTDDADERGQSLLRSIAIFERQLGPVHPDTITARIITGGYTVDPGAALTIIAPACDALARLAPDEVLQRARCLAHVSHHHGESGDTAEANASMRKAGELLRRVPSHAHLSEVKIIRGLAAALDGGDVQLEDELQEQIQHTDSDEWWLRSLQGEMRFALAALLLARDDRNGAAAVMAAAIDDFIAGNRDGGEVVYHQRLNHLRIALAELALTDERSEPGRLAQATRHLDAALEWYADKGAAYEWRRQRIHELQRDLGMRSAPARAPARG
jgi:hypothetical protein